MMQRSVWFTTEFIAFHQWKDAPLSVSYLKEVHRHVFKVRVEVKVTDHDREIEFHSLKGKIDMWIRLYLAGRTLTESCEMIAERIAIAVNTFAKVIEVSVSEDGECGGTVRYTDA